MLKEGSTWFLKEREMFDCSVCVCVCVCFWWAFVWACKRETERESKKGWTWFSKEREEKKKKLKRFQLNFWMLWTFKRKRKKLISLHWKNLFPHFVKIHFPTSTSIQKMALHWSILNFLNFYFKTHIFNETKTFSLI